MKRWNFLGDRRVVMVIMSIAMVWAFLSFATITNTQGVQSAPWAHGYQLRNLVSCPNGVGFSATLQLTKNTSTYGEDIQALTLSVSIETFDCVHVHITSAGVARWEIPQTLLPRPEAHVTPTTCPHLPSNVLPRLLVSFTEQPFGFAITRRRNGEVLFNSTPPTTNAFNPLVFKDQYLEISTSLPKAGKHTMFGLGESTQPTGMKLQVGTTYTLFADDQASLNTNINLYGSHPFYMDVREGGLSHGVHLMNSNGMDVVYRPTSLTFKVIGGVLDFYFFAGASPLAVVDQYTKLVGRPAAMPYWALGWHQSKWGYKTLQHLEAVVGNYSAASIPLDTVWSDIDFMDAYRDFTVDPVAFPLPKLQQFVAKLHANKQHYVVIVDPGIKVQAGSSPYARGKAADVFIKDVRGRAYLGQVWPGITAFPDFLHPGMPQFWQAELASLHKKTDFDGLWIDMNEVSNFCTGVTCDTPPTTCPANITVQLECCLTCSNALSTRWDDPPYKINNRGVHAPLGNGTVAMSATHYGGVREYDAHSLYGLSEGKVTRDALIKISKKRPFILSRSTFPGSGAYGAHWSGDNAASWKDLQYSITQIQNFGMLGSPMVGADICGFYGSTTEELCNRWTSVGAFYPFARNHAVHFSAPQEPYNWHSVTTAAKTAIGMRYRLLPYWYTLNYEAHTKGAPMARPLFFSFPLDWKTLDIHLQFMVGRSLLVSPVLFQNAVSVNAYFPAGRWWNLFNYDQVQSTRGVVAVLDAPLGTIPVHVYQGSIIPMQVGGLTTAAAKTTPFSLLLTFGASSSKDQTATGELFLDSGDSLAMKLTPGVASHIKFSATLHPTGSGTLGSTVVYPSFAMRQGWVVNMLTVLGGPRRVRSVLVNGKSYGPRYSTHKLAAGFVLHLIRVPLGENMNITWIAM